MYYLVILLVFNNGSVKNITTVSLVLVGKEGSVFFSVSDLVQYPVAILVLK